MSEKKNTRSPARSPPRKEKNGIGERNFRERLAIGKNPQTMEPSVAPDEIPRIPESARGFLKNPWNTAPLPPSRAPHTAQRIILGSLISKRIINFIPSLPPAARSAKDIFSAPKKVDANETAARRKKRTTVPRTDFVFICLDR